jgi:hypothetical protein
MRTLAGHFLNPSSGEMAVFVRIVALKELITFQAKPLEPGYTSVAGASDNLR